MSKVMQIYGISFIIIWCNRNFPFFGVEYFFCLFYIYVSSKLANTHQIAAFPLEKQIVNFPSNRVIRFVFLEGPKIIVRTEEVLIVLAVLLLWVAAIALFFNRWGKIRMLEPYQPKFQQQHRSSCPLVELEAIPVHKHPSLSRVSMGVSLPAQMTYGRMGSISGASSGPNLYTVRGKPLYLPYGITFFNFFPFALWTFFKPKRFCNIYFDFKQRKQTKHFFSAPLLSPLPITEFSVI